MKLYQVDRNTAQLLGRGYDGGEKTMKKNTMMKTTYATLALAGILAVSAGLSGCAEDTTGSEAGDTKRTYNVGTSESSEGYFDASAEGETISSGGIGSTEPGWTLMIYLCGSDLESEGSMASMNLEEMCNASIPEDVNVLVETGGSSAWNWDGISADALGRYQIVDGDLEEVETVELASMGDPATLTDFIQWGISNYPSERYGVILWDLVNNTQDHVETDGTALLSAIDKAVLYSVHGPGRGNANGISVFYPIGATKDELLQYMENSDNTPYLQYIAAVTDTYDAVDWEAAWERYDSSGAVWSSSETEDDDSWQDLQEDLTELQPVTGNDFDVQFLQSIGKDGYLNLSITSGLEAVKSVHFLLLYMPDGQEDGSSSEYVYLGEDNDIDSDWENGSFRDYFWGQWMTIGGEYVNAELIEETDNYNLYSIPAEVNGKETNIHAIYDYSTEEYRVLGTYDGVEDGESSGSMTSRGITPLEEGDEIVFLLPAYEVDSDEEAMYTTDAVTWSKDVVMEDEDMGDGFYMYMFEIEDMFGVEYDADPVVMEAAGDTIYPIME